LSRGTKKVFLEQGIVNSGKRIGIKLTPLGRRMLGWVKTSEIISTTEHRNKVSQQSLSKWADPKIRERIITRRREAEPTKHYDRKLYQDSARRAWITRKQLYGHRGTPKPYPKRIQTEHDIWNFVSEQY